jgi:hypothetical protein
MKGVTRIQDSAKRHPAKSVVKAKPETKAKTKAKITTALQPKAEAITKYLKPCNPKQGVFHAELAFDFVADHPIGTRLGSEALDAWLEKKGELVVPVVASKQEPEWVAHVIRRNDLRRKINKAAAHSRMDTPFRISVIAPETYEVQSAQDAAISEGTHGIPNKVKGVYRTRRRAWERLIRSADWAALPSHYQAILESTVVAEDSLENLIETQTKAIEKTRKIWLQAVKKGIESGEIVPKNGALKALLGYPKNENGAGH